jgi:ferredoxin
MKNNALKTLRVLFAVLFFLPVFFFFCDFTHKLPNEWTNLLKIQVIPAILAGAAGIILALALLTFFFGRIYCSVICPMGVFQDIIAWFTRRGKKKNRKKRWYHYTRSCNLVRWTLLGFCVVFLLFGISTPVLFLDPYSNFGRIATNIFRPVIMEGNNWLGLIAMKLNNYTFYQVTLHTVTPASFLISLTALLTVGILALLRGRLFCNTICPVGSLLGLFSRFAVFRMTVDESRCNKCSLCEKSCKSECIDSKAGSIDASRCVACFNCLDMCAKKALQYRIAYKQPVAKSEKQKIVGDKMKMAGKFSRRSFLATGTAMAVTVPLVPAWARVGNKADITKLTPITPPGSKSLQHFKKHCTACHLCVTHCPQQILKPAGFNFGLNYAFKPHMVYYEMAFCNYECTVCSEICPNGAIRRLTVDEKKVTQIGIAQFERDRCIVFTDHTSCGACSEHCPVQAVRMEPFMDGLTIPHVYEEFCIGCGGCESICPARPLKAINILANEVHQTAQQTREEEMKKIEDLDFGF